MKLRRVLTSPSQSIEVLRGRTWVPFEPEQAQRDPLLAMLQSCPVAEGKPGVQQTGSLPFQPRSYRDFMLFGQHYEQAARGFVKRFRPRVSRISGLFESITGRTFPAFRPHPLWYRKPIYYMGNHLRFVTEGAEIAWPSYTNALDYELELGFVLARPIRDATPEQAMAAIGGFVVFNDFSARDVQNAEMSSGFGPQKAKHFCNAISAVLVTADEILPHIDNLSGRVVINDRIVAECRSRNMQFTIGEALAHASADEELEPGEFFGTGTWPNGSGMENGTWLQPGDVIRLEIDGVGTLTNTIGQRAPKRKPAGSANRD
jgi:2-keto-4-pentenoate hydratase/2-oxohepta-3-ene-1,7-dioic acid hydratase in catechol pathway